MKDFISYYKIHFRAPPLDEAILIRRDNGLHVGFEPLHQNLSDQLIIYIDKANRSEVGDSQGISYLRDKGNDREWNLSILEPQESTKSFVQE